MFYIVLVNLLTTLQMLHGARPLNQPTIKGKVLRMRVDEHTDETVNTDREVYYQGDVIEAANAVTLGELDRGKESFSFHFFEQSQMFGLSF
jgi:hypothetical protein